jgi:Plasmid pRiA4b ORF-3-like protein
MPEMIVRLHVTLLDVDPAIWRRIEIPASSTLKTLHDVLQRAMGWFDYHLHHFEIGGILYGKPSPDDADFDRDIVDERQLKLLALAEKGAKTLGSVTAYHSFGGEVEASNTPTIRRLTSSCRHQLSCIAQRHALFGNVTEPLRMLRRRGNRKRQIRDINRFDTTLTLSGS